MILDMVSCPSPDEDWVVIERDDANSLERQLSTSDKLSRISRHIDSISDELRTISLDIHDHPELRFNETHAHHVLTTYLQSQPGWKVTPSAYGLATAFVAVFEGQSPGAVVSFNAEYGLHQPRVPPHLG